MRFMHGVGVQASRQRMLCAMILVIGLATVPLALGEKWADAAPPCSSDYELV